MWLHFSQGILTQNLTRWPADSNSKSAQLSKISESGSAINDFSWIDFHYIYGKENAFLTEDAVNAPGNAEDATKCYNVGTRSARRRRDILGKTY